MAESLPGSKKMRKTHHLELLQQAVKIRQKLRDGNPKDKLNILLLGMPGVGKSTLVSSLLMAINHRGYQDIAMRGGYGEGGKAGRAAITLTVQKHSLFGYITDFQRSKEYQYKCQPHVWDCPGLPDEDEPTTPILRLIIDGEMKDDANMSEMLKMTPQELKKMRIKQSEDRIIDAIVVVHAATDPIPSNLMTAIRNAAQPNEQEISLVPMFGVISKLDLLEEKGQGEELENIVEAFSEEIGLKGAEERVFPTRLYCKAVSVDLTRKHDIDKVMCDLWEAILSTQFKRVKRNFSEQTRMDKVKGFVSGWFSK